MASLQKNKETFWSSKKNKKNRFYKAGPESRNYRLFFENIKIDSSYFDFDVDRKDDSQITF